MNEKAQLLLDFFDRLSRGRGPKAPCPCFVRAARARRPPGPPGKLPHRKMG